MKQEIDLNYGIWHSDTLDIGVLTSDMLIVGVKHHNGTLTNYEIDNLVGEHIKSHFPNHKILVVQGALTLENLSGSKDFRKMICDVLYEAMR